MPEKTETERRMHQAIDEAVPELRKLVGELRTDRYYFRADALEEVASKLAMSRTSVQAHNGGRR